MTDALSLPPWLTATQYAVLRELVGLLERWDVPYVATGGLAGNLHGSRWPLHDLDFDVPGAVLRRVATRYPGAVRFGPAPYADAEFALELLTLRLDGVDVDLTAAETVVLRTPEGAHRPWPTDLAVAERRRVGELAVRVLPLHLLVAYKRLIGRHADLRELDALAGTWMPGDPRDG